MMVAFDPTIAAATVSAFGLDLGTPFQGGIFGAALLMLGVVVRTYIMGMPDRARVDIERKTVETAEATERYRAWRLDIHDLKNDIARVSAKQVITDGQLSAALAINRHLRSQMTTMLFLVGLLISELKRLDPKSVIVRQAEMTLEEMESHTQADPSKSDAMNIAETAVADAKQTLASTKETCEEVKRVEGEEDKK
jgi:hypothetical protein